MDQQKPDVNQRQQLRRTGAEWEELALKLLLLYPDTAIAIRDADWTAWQRHAGVLSDLTRAPYYADQIFLGILGIQYKAYPCNRIAKALRKMRKEHLRTLSPEARKREYAIERAERDRRS